ncbi:MAG: isochorismatase family protein [Coriobacteriia bacterium]
MPAPTIIRGDQLVVVVVDVQERLAAAMERRDEVESAVALLAGAAGVLGAPLVVTRQNPEGIGDLTPRVAEVLAEAEASGTEVLRVDKMHFCCASEVAFSNALAATSRHHIVIAGMETHICVAQTALALHSVGMLVHVLADGCCSRRGRDHDVALDRLRAAGVTVTTTEAAIYEALGRAGTDEFRAVLRLVKNA